MGVLTEQSQKKQMMQILNETGISGLGPKAPQMKKLRSREIRLYKLHILLLLQGHGRIEMLYHRKRCHTWCDFAKGVTYDPDVQSSQETQMPM